jgi:hypothetical protein
LVGRTNPARMMEIGRGERISLFLLLPRRDEQPTKPLVKRQQATDSARRLLHRHPEPRAS